MVSIMRKTTMFWFLIHVGFCATYKPVVFIHGFNGTEEDGDLIKDIIQKVNHSYVVTYTVALNEEFI